jgi:hypothetical protein
VYLARHWREVSEYRWIVDWARLAAASGLVVAGYSGYVLAWRRLLCAFGGSLSIVDAHRIWYLGNLGRYVPGKIFQLAGTAYMARAKGVSPVVTVAASVTAQLFVLGGALVVAGLLLPTVAAGPGRALVVAGALAAALFAVVTLSPLFDVLHRFALQTVGRPELHIRVPLAERLLGLAATSALIGAYGFAFYLFVTAVTTAPRGAILPLVGVNAIAYLAGYLAVFAPGGLGVREGVYALLLGAYIPASIAVAVAILARLWLTLCELAVVVLLVVRYGIGDLRSATETTPRTIHG